MAAPSYIGNGGIAASDNSATVAVPFPSLQANDILLLQLLSAENDTHQQPTGFTSIGTINQSTAQTSSWWWKRAAGTESGNLTCSRSNSGDAFFGVMSCWRGAVTSGTPFNSAGPTSADSINPSSSTITPTYDYAAVICLINEENNVAISNITGFTEAFEVSSTTGDDADFTANYIYQTTAAEVAAATATIANAQSWATVTLALWSPIPTTINATKATATGTPYDPTIQIPAVPTNVSATLATATGTGYAATVEADVDTVVEVLAGGALVDSKSTPATGTTFLANADGKIIFTFTYEATNFVRIDFRYDAWNDCVFFQACNYNGRVEFEYNDGTLHVLDFENSILSNGVSYTVEINYNGTALTALVNDVERLSCACSHNLTSTGGRITHDLDTNDIELASYELGSGAALAGTPLAATINVGTGITATVGTATATNYAATITVPEPTTVNCTKGAATSTAYAATVQADVDVTVIATVGASTSTAYAATVQADVDIGITTTAGSLTATGNAATVEAEVETTVNVATGTATATSYVAEVLTSTIVGCDAAVVIVAGNNPLIGEQTVINLGSGAAVAVTGYNSTVTATESTTVNCTVGAATATGLAAAVTMPLTISATAGTATATSYDSTVFAALVIDCTLGTVAVTGKNAAISLYETYYVRADGEATKANATSEASASTSMSLATYHSSTFNLYDTVYFSSLGGDFRAQLTLKQGVYNIGTSNTPTFNASDLKTGWTNYSGDVWQASLAAQPQQIWIDENFGDRQASIVACVNEYDWYWDDAADTIYLYAPGDPDTQYTSPGVEVCSRNYGVSASDSNFAYIENVITSKAKLVGIYVTKSSNVTIKDNLSEWCWNNNIGLLGQSGTMDNVLIEGNECRYGAVAGIQISRGAGTTISNVTIRYNHCHHINTYHEANPWWDNAHMWPGGIKIYSGDLVNLSGFEIYENHVHDIGGPIQDKGNGIWPDFVTSADHANGCRIYRNCIHDTYKSGIFIESCRYVQAFNNLVYDCSTVSDSAGIRVDAREDATGSGLYNLVYNNTIYGGRNGVQVLSYYHVPGGDEISYNEVKNNIILGATTYDMELRDGGDNDGTYGTGNVYTYNCLGAEPIAVYWDAATKTTYDTWETSYGGSTYSVEADPALKDTANDKYYLTSASPCIDAGVDLGAIYDDGLDPNLSAAGWTDSVKTLDQDSWGTGWEIGAYVYDYADVATATATAYAATILNANQTVNVTAGSATVTGYDVGLAADLVIPCTSDAVTGAGYDASISTESGIAISCGSITATALAATVTALADTTVTASSGTATGTAYDATVQADVDVSITATAGTATATDYAAVVNVGTGIMATAGTATATGYDVALAADNSITATLGTATATGNAAIVALGAFIAADVAAATVTGYDPTVLAALAIPATAGTATATGYDATVAADLVVPVTLGVVTVTGYAAGLDANTVVMATVANAIATALNASIAGITTIGATKAAATATGYAADVGADVTITATLDSAALTALDALLAADVTTVATKGTVTVTGCNPLVLLPIDITATLGTATATANAAAVNVGTGITAGVAAATGTAHNPTAYVPLGIDQTSTPAITVTGLDPTVFEGIINIRCGTITVTAKVPTVTIPFRFLISPTITSSTISYTTTSSSLDYSIEELA